MKQHPLSAFPFGLCGEAGGSAIPSDFAERRRHPRYVCDLGVEVRVGDSDSGYWGTLADICIGGCYITTFSPLPQGTSVVLVIKNEEKQITMPGRTVTFHPGVGMGVEFTGYLTENGETELRALLGMLARAAGA